MSHPETSFRILLAIWSDAAWSCPGVSCAAVSSRFATSLLTRFSDSFFWRSPPLASPLPLPCGLPLGDLRTWILRWSSREIEYGIECRRGKRGGRQGGRMEGCKVKGKRIRKGGKFIFYIVSRSRCVVYEYEVKEITKCCWKLLRITLCVL
jgi:hypothetical protein